MNFKYHIKQIRKKIAKALFSIKRVKNVLTPSALKSLYYSTIHSHLVYAIQIYSCASKTDLSPLIILQKKSIRCITNSSYNAHTAHLFRNLEILPFDDLAVFFKAQFMCIYSQNKTPKSFENKWIKNSDRFNNEVQLRNINDYHIPPFRINLVNKLPLCDFPRLYNELPLDLKSIHSKNIFNSSLKKHLLDKLPETVVCNRLLCPTCLQV